jgi:hypothetical protein
MKTITRPVATVGFDAEMLRQGRFTVHEALLDGDENLTIGSKILVHDCDITYLSATVTAHEDDLWELTLQREHR